MVSHISPSHFHFEETRNTLAYADRAKNITTKVSEQNYSEIDHKYTDATQYRSLLDLTYAE